MVATRYPPANWLGDGKTGGSYYSADGVLGPWRIVFHTTETAGLPGYNLGKSAPHLTYDARTRKWYQHTNLDVAARALRNQAGGVQTNRERAIQVEIICYSNKPVADIKSYRTWVGDLTDENYTDLQAFILWAREEFGIQLHWPRKQAFGYSAANVPGFRMADREWDQFGGICGHQHVPENYHWDPGALDWAKLMAFPTEETEPVPLTPYEQAAVDNLLAEGVFTQYSVDEEGELDADVSLKKLAVFLNRVLREIDEAVAEAVAANDANPATQAKVAELEAEVNALKTALAAAGSAE